MSDGNAGPKPRDKVKALFQSLIWPAAAGNVVWALVTLIVEPKPSNGLLAIILALSVVAIYMGFGWWLTEFHTDNVKKWYWFFDLLHLLPIVVFAIAAQLQTETRTFLEVSLGLVFASAVFGHLFGAWESKDKPGKPVSRALSAASNLIGVLVLILANTVASEWFTSLWQLPTAAALALGGWIVVQRRYPN